MITSLSTLNFDDVATEIISNGGVATIDLPEHCEKLNSHAFEVARQAIDQAYLHSTKDESSNQNSSGSIPWVHPDANAAHVTGFHSAGSSSSLSRYNAHREGFIFSDDHHTMAIPEIPEFESTMENLYQMLHEIAKHVMSALERKFDIPLGWFESTMGPTTNSNQWHVKRYVQEAEREIQEKNTDNGSNEYGKSEKILLPMHTDPSLVSVVILDAAGSNPSALGLQYSALQEGADKNQRVWKDVPRHGHRVAIVFVGSVLSHITGGKCASVKHRVVLEEGSVPGDRMAATLFLRPKGSAMLQVPLGPNFRDTPTVKQNTFDTWINRVSKNYKKKQK